MKKLMLGLMMAFAVTASAEETQFVDGIEYSINGPNTVVIVGYSDDIPANVNISEVELNGNQYRVVQVCSKAFHGCKKITSVSLLNCYNLEGNAFVGCDNLVTVCLPNVSFVEGEGFSGCPSLSSLIVPSDLKPEIENDRNYYGLQQKVVIAGVLQKRIIEDAEYKIILKDYVGRDVDENDYKFACEIYGIAPAIKPQFVPESSIVVSKESIQAAKAETVTVADGVVSLGVSVLSNADITASVTKWSPVKFTKDTQIGLSEDGTKLILPIPVAAQQGFMILQSGDAKVSEGGVRVPVTGKPWYTPTVED